MEHCDHNNIEDNLKASYGAIVDYHNNLVHMRFTVAGLFVAANGFLASGLFQTIAPAVPWYALPTLGIGLSAICWLLEIRTYQLLNNLASRGKKLEENLGISDSSGFFSLMNFQSIGPRLLVTRLRLPTNRFIRYIVSHSFGIGILYLTIAAFWVFIILVRGS